MNTPRISHAIRTGSALALSLFAALSVQAADAGEQTYRRIVLGDTSIAAPQVQQSAERVVPGSYARYLIKNGVDSKQALATARATGELPTIERVDDSVASGELTGRQIYDRVMGIAG